MSDDLFASQHPDAPSALPADALPKPSALAPDTRRSRPKWVIPFLAALLGAAVAVGVVVAVSAPSAPADPGSFTLRGVQTVTAGVSTQGGSSSCQGGLGYQDMTAGAPVTVYDEGGKIVGIGSLSGGVLDSAHGSAFRDIAPCIFFVTVPNVVKGPKFYQVEVSHRGKITISAADAEAGRFTAVLGN